MGTCPLPWFPIYASETLADSNFATWDPAERGCWFTLITRCWADGSIPSDPELLARLCGSTAQAMPKHWEHIQDRFIPHPTLSGRLISPRVELEREKAIASAEKMTTRGKNGAARRWQKEKEEMLKHCLGSAQGMLADASSPSPSPNTPIVPTGTMDGLTEEESLFLERALNEWPRIQPGSKDKSVPLSKPRKTLEKRWTHWTRKRKVHPQVLFLACWHYQSEMVEGGHYLKALMNFLSSSAGLVEEHLDWARAEAERQHGENL